MTDPQAPAPAAPPARTALPQPGRAQTSGDERDGKGGRGTDQLFGGNISRTARTRSVCWQLTGKAAVARALEVLDAGTIPSKKRREVKLLIEAISLVPPRSVNIQPAAARRLHELRDELKAARVYVEQVA